MPGNSSASDDTQPPPTKKAKSQTSANRSTAMGNWSNTSSTSASALRNACSEGSPSSRTRSRTTGLTSVDFAPPDPLSFRSFPEDSNPEDSNDDHCTANTEEDHTESEKLTLLKFENELNENSRDAFTSEEDRGGICLSCGEDPCHWITLGDKLIEGVLAKYTFIEGESNITEDTANITIVPKSTARKHCYQTYSYQIFGYLGKGKQITIPAVLGIKSKNDFQRRMMKTIWATETSNKLLFYNT
jgi:hypothetical protein